VEVCEGSPPIFLNIACAECGKWIEAKIGVDTTLDLDELKKWIYHWVISITSPLGSDKIVMAPVCGECAPKVFPPEVLKRAQENMGPRAS
jgi:hypothetical protein